MSVLSSPVLPQGYVSAKSYGVRGDGATDDRVALQAAIAGAHGLNAILELPPSVMNLPRAPGLNHSIIIENIKGLKIRGTKGRTWLRHPSNAASGVGSCQLLRITQCEDVTIEGVGFDGNWGNAYTHVTADSDLDDLSATAILNVDDTSEFPASGSATIVTRDGDQVFTYTGKTATTFTGCTFPDGGYVQKYDQIGLIDKKQKTTVVAAASDGATLPQATINVEDTTKFPSSAGAGLVRIQTSLGYQEIQYTGKTGTSFTGCTGGTGTLSTNFAVEYVDGGGNQAVPMQVDPKNHAIFIYGTDNSNAERPNRNIVIQDVLFRDLYGDAVWVGAYSYDVKVINSHCETSARNGITLSSFADGFSMVGSSFRNIFTSALDSEPVDSPTKRVTIDDCEFGIWFNPYHAVANIAMSIQGGSQGRPAEWTYCSNWSVTRSRFAGTVLISTARGIFFGDHNEIIVDHSNPQTFAPLVVQMYADDVWVDDCYVWSRAPGSTISGKGLINVTRYQTAPNTAAQPANVRITRNNLDPRAGLSGIYIETVGGYEGYDGTATLLTAPSSPANLGEIDVAGTPWAAQLNYWAGHQVLMGGKLASIVGNTSNKLYIAPLHENYAQGSAWSDAWGRRTTDPAAGTFTILPQGGRVHCDGNIVDCRNIDGAGAGGIGIEIATDTTWDPGFNHMRISLKDNDVRGATGPAYSINTFNTTTKWKELQLIGNHAWDDQPTPTCTAAFMWVNPDGIEQKTIHGNTKDDNIPVLHSGLASGSWRTSGDYPETWAGYEDPNDLIYAPPTSTYQRLNANVLYLKESPASASTGWTALKGNVRANVRDIGELATGTGALDMTGKMPASVDGDIELLFINANLASGSAGAAATLSTPARFVKKLDAASNYSANTIVNRPAIWWRRKRPGDVAPVIADAGDCNEAIVVAVKDCIAYGDPFEFATAVTNTALSTSVATAGGTTSVDGALFMEFLTWFNGGTLGTAEDWANVDSDLIEEADVYVDARAVGTEKIGLALWGGRVDAVATVGSSTATITAGSYALWSTISFALKPAQVLARATGTITCVAKASLVDGDYLTIGDGISPLKLYEFDLTPNGVTAGRIVVDVSTDTTAAQVAARLRTAILANQPSLSVTDNADGTLSITHNWPGSGGNVAMTENVANAGFTVAGLTGGQG